MYDYNPNQSKYFPNSAKGQLRGNDFTNKPSNDLKNALKRNLWKISFITKSLTWGISLSFGGFVSNLGRFSQILRSFYVKLAFLEGLLGSIQPGAKRASY